MTMGEIKHLPVMVREVLSAFLQSPPKRHLFLDCTVGMGGHSEAILAATPSDVKVIGVDRDAKSLKEAAGRLACFEGRFILRKGSFLEIPQIVRALNLKEVDGILFDLGISSYQLDQADRGFSFQKSAMLDMRMDQEQSETASDIINRLSRTELISLIGTYGEERWASRIASAIVHYRDREGAILRTDELERIIWTATPAAARHGRIHPATRTFQALRIAVNTEIEQLEKGLPHAISMLSVGGRVGVITFHSLEDRCVKRTFRKFSQVSETRRFLSLSKKPAVPTEEERRANPRSRSAKLRLLERAA